MTDFEAQILADMSVLKAQMQELLGIGQPGRLTRMESRMHEHEKALQRMKGMAGAFGGMLTVAHFAIDFVIGHR
ncbi:MAG TPA: hypothetical protein VGU46_11000 [Acidobacteriaceae bacterium]|nr:hypothetical protein [Acidobacteriaceae bacterium]